MKKLFYTMLIVFFLLKFHYDGKCVESGYDFSRITSSGVYCHSDNIFKPYKLLRDIDTRPVPFNETKLGTT